MAPPLKRDEATFIWGYGRTVFEAWKKNDIRRMQGEAVETEMEKENREKKS